MTLDNTHSQWHAIHPQKLMRRSVEQLQYDRHPLQFEVSTRAHQHPRTSTLAIVSVAAPALLIPDAKPADAPCGHRQYDGCVAMKCSATSVLLLLAIKQTTCSRLTVAAEKAGLWLVQSPGGGNKWAIKANACWSTHACMQYQHTLPPPLLCSQGLQTAHASSEDAKLRRSQVPHGA
jgi:hypothetical protein